MRVSALAIANFLLAAGMTVIGWPSIRAELHRLPAEVTISAAQSGQTVTEDQLDSALPMLESATASSTTAREDLAFVLLSGVGSAASAAEQGERAARAAHELRAYLAEVPGDARGWAGLGRAELIEGHPIAAREALKLSILTSPWSPELVLWRCDLGIDLYATLDDEARDLLQEQFRVAAERSPRSLARLAQRKNAVVMARVMLAQSPEALSQFEEGLRP